MRWPQIVVLSWMGIGLLCSVYIHEKEVKVNFWSRLISTAITILILWKGGFF